MSPFTKTPKTNGIFYVGTRGSQLALWQTNAVIAQLCAKYPHLVFEIKTYKSAGDIDTEKPLPAIEGKGVFTQALDEALMRREIHIAVHSHKDLPITSLGVISTACVLKREQVNDVVVAKNRKPLSAIATGSVIGTSSTRRSAQLLAMKRGFVMENIRGNVDTRIKKVFDETSPFQATLLAYAGVHRLNLLDFCTEILPLDLMLPAPAQGSIAVQCLKDTDAFSLCQAIDHYESRCSTEAERGFLFGLGGGCSMPIAAYAVLENGLLSFKGKVLRTDGSREIFVEDQLAITERFTINDAFDYGIKQAKRALDLGAKDLLST